MSFSLSAIEIAPAIVAAGLTVLGASSALQASRWLIVLRDLFARPATYFLGAIVELVAGLFLALSYNRWEGTWPLFTTLLGWLMAIEGAAFLLAPDLFRGFNRLSDGTILKFLRFGGIAVLILGVLLGRFVLNS